MVVRIDPHVLDDVATRTTALADEVHGLLAEARRLDAGWAVNRLSEVPAWAEDTAVDLRARLGIVHVLEQQPVTFVGYAGTHWREIAGGRTSVAESMNHLQTLATQPDVDAQWERRPGETLDDWVTRVRGVAIDRMTRLDGVGQPIAETYTWFRDYVDVVAAGGMSAVAATHIAKVSVTRELVVPLMQRLGMPEPSVRNALSRYGTYRAPGTTLQSLLARAVPLDRTTSVPPYAQRWAVNHGLRSLLPAVEARLPSLATTVHNGIFGARDYTFRTLDAAGKEITVTRGTSNLVAVARDAPAGSRLSTVARTAGVLRGAGVVGSAASAVTSTAQVISHGNPVEAFKRDGAGYVADIAKVGFDVSMTAALIAPSPITWGAVAVTGVVYAGAEIVDHWDDITAATEKAADWVGDQTTKAATFVADQLDDIDDVGDVVDKAGQVLDAVADSTINPMSWF